MLKTTCTNTLSTVYLFTFDYLFLYTRMLYICTHKNGGRVSLIFQTSFRKSFMTMENVTDRLDDLYAYLAMWENEREEDLCKMGYNISREGEEMEFEEAIDYWHGENSALLPSWAHLKVVGFEEEQELYHRISAENAAKIVAEGFKGITNLARVATSTAFRTTAQYDATGFAFAYRLADVVAGEVDNPGWFGDVELKFTARSLRVASEFDGEEQSIFIAGEARNIEIILL